MKASNAKRLYETEVKWVDCGSGDAGRNKGKCRKSKKARAHATRLERLRKLAGIR